MALQLKTEQFGVLIPSAYVRLEQIKTNIFEGTEVIVRYYVSNPGAQPNIPNIPAFRESFFVFEYKEDGKDIFEQAYNAAKLLKEFAGAINC